MKHFEQKNLKINENREKIQDPRIYDLKNNNVFDLRGYTFSQDNVSAPYNEQTGTNLQTVPACLVHSSIMSHLSLISIVSPVETCKHLI